jgi:hypothetical protein
MPEPTPVPPFSRPLPADVAVRIKATAAARPERRGRRLAALVLAAGVLGGAYAVSVPAGEAQAMRKDCVPVVVVDAFGNKYTVENDSC